MPGRQQLTDLQTDVLQLTAAQIWEQVYAERGLAQTTVATIVARLQRRGILARRRLERQFVYRALISESAVQHAMVSELTERLFGGDVTALVSHLLLASDMTPGDLTRVRKLNAQARKAAVEALGANTER